MAQISPRIKIALATGSNVEVGTASLIGNRLAGLEYSNLNLEKPWANLRILDFSWSSTCEVQLWDCCGPVFQTQPLHPVCFLDTCGLIVVSGDVPRAFIDRNAPQLDSKEMPIMWLIPEHNYRYSSQESALSGYNIHKVQFSRPSDEIIHSEFNGWITKAMAYLSAKG